MSNQESLLQFLKRLALLVLTLLGWLIKSPIVFTASFLSRGWSENIRTLKQLPISFGESINAIRAFFPIFLDYDRKNLKKNPSKTFLYTVVGAVLAFGTWAAISEFDQVITSEGKVVPSASLQTVNHMEGGVISKVHVKAGELVKAGTPLISLNPLEAGAGFQSKQFEFFQTLAKIRRLEAELREKEPEFGGELESQHPNLVKTELLILASRKKRLEANLASFDAQSRQKKSELVGAQKTMGLVAQELDVVRKLVERGLEPNLEAVRAEKTFAETEARVQSIQASIDEVGDRKNVAIQEYQSEVLAELAKAAGEFNLLEQSVPVAADRADRSVLRAPTDGVVNRVLITTVGGVLKPGEPVVEIVPMDTRLLVEVKVNPADIGFVQPEQRASVKLSTYDFSIFGSLVGLVEVVGADTLTNEKGDTYYLVKVVPLSNVSSVGRELQLMPGMTAQVDIIVGKRSALSYLSSPITKTISQAFKEK
jgi:membrane fusion protein, adhesin transport system